MSSSEPPPPDETPTSPAGDPYGTPPPAPPSYDQPPTYPEPTYGQPAYGQPAYGQPAYGQPAYGQPAYGQPAYGQPAYGQPAYGVPPGFVPPQSSGKAIGALVTGIAGLFAICCGLFVVSAIVAVVLGVQARREVAASQGRLTGDGMALTGIITGAIGIALALAWVGLVIVNGTLSSF